MSCCPSPLVFFVLLCFCFCRFCSAIATEILTGGRIFLACGPTGLVRDRKGSHAVGEGQQKEGRFPLLTFWFSNSYSSQVFSSWDDVTHFRVGLLFSVPNAIIGKPRSWPLSPR